MRHDLWLALLDSEGYDKCCICDLVYNISSINFSMRLIINMFWHKIWEKVNLLEVKETSYSNISQYINVSTDMNKSIPNLKVIKKS